MDGTAAGYVVTAILGPVAAGGGVAEVAEVVVAVEAAEVVDSGPELISTEKAPKRGLFLIALEGEGVPPRASGTPFFGEPAAKAMDRKHP